MKQLQRFDEQPADNFVYLGAFHYEDDNEHYFGPLAGTLQITHGWLRDTLDGTHVGSINCEGDIHFYGYDKTYTDVFVCLPAGGDNV